MSAAPVLEESHGVVTWWPNLCQPQGREERFDTWDELFQRFERAEAYLGDKRHPGWSAAVFEGARRGGDHVRSVTAAVLDYDGSSSLDEAATRWEGFYGLIHTTRRHTAEKHRFRVVLPLSRAVSPAEWGRLWQRLQQQAGGKLDPQAKDASRFWFMPGVGEGGEYRLVRLDGQVLDPDEWLAKPAPALEKPRPVARHQTASEIERRAIAYIDRMPAAISGSGGHQATWAVAIVLARGFDLDEETTFRLLRDHYNPRCTPEWSDRELSHKARQAINADAPRGFLVNDDRPWKRGRYQLPAEPSPTARDACAEEWPAPEPIGRDVVPPGFPVDLLPDWIGNFVRAEAESVQVPIDMPAMFALGTLAGVTGGHVRVRAWEGFEDSTNLYTVVAMPPSSVKSPVHRHVTAPIARVEEEMQQSMGPEIARAMSRRAIAEKRLKRAEEEAARADGPEGQAALQDAYEARQELDQATVPAAPRLLVDDATPEQLKTVLAEQKGRVAMLSAESALFGNIASQRYSKDPNLEVILAAHSGDDVRVDRRGRSEILRDPRLTICIAVQPSVLRQAHESVVARERGLFARFLYVMPPSNVGYRDLSKIPPQVPEYVRNEWDRRLRTIAHAMRQRGEPLVLPLSTEARDVFQAWRAGMEPQLRPGGELVSIEAWAGKLPGHVLRLAGLVHVADDESGKEIGPETIEKAIALAAYFTAHAMVAFDAMGDDERFAKVRKVLAWIRVKGESAFTRSAAQVAFKGRLNRDELSDALSILVDHGHLRRARQKGPGRPAEVFDVNPEVFR